MASVLAAATAAGSHLCPHCAKSFANKTKRKRHVQSVHEDIRNHDCVICDVMFHSAKDVRQHMAVHNNTALFPCSRSHCQKSFASEAYRNRHVASQHQQINNTIMAKTRHQAGKKQTEAYITCERCGKQLKGKACYSKHIRQVHEQEGPTHECPICAVMFHSKTFLRDHTAVKHNAHGVRPLCCETCEKTFETSVQLRQHAIRHQKPAHKCTKCDRSCFSLSELKAHVQTVHATEQSFACAHCEKRYKSALLLKFHLATHAPPAHECHKCERKFSFASNLKRHLSLIHDTANAKRYTCDQCERTFLLAANLKKHQLCIRTRDHRK